MDMKLLYNKMKNKIGQRPMLFPRKNRKAMSTIVTAVIMIALVMVAVAIVWVVVRNIIQDRLEGAESCFGIYEKVTINNIYTCYDSTNSQFQFSINIRDIDVDKVIVSVSGAGATNSYELTNQSQTIENLANYESTGFGTDIINLPEKNSGLTYVASGFTAKPDLIQIAPVIGGELCGESDSLAEIDECI